MMEKRFLISDREVGARILSLTADRARLSIEGQVFEVELSSISPFNMTLVCDSAKLDYSYTASSRGGWMISHEDGESYVSETQRLSSSKEFRDHQTCSPMPGKVIKIFVRVGEEVDEGTPLVAIEAMKMEHVLKSRQKSIVKELLCCEGDTVQGQVSLLSFE